MSGSLCFLLGLTTGRPRRQSVSHHANTLTKQISSIPALASCAHNDIPENDTLEWLKWFNRHQCYNYQKWKCFQCSPHNMKRGQSRISSTSPTASLGSGCGKACRGFVFQIFTSSRAQTHIPTTRQMINHDAFNKIVVKTVKINTVISVYIC